MTKDQRSGLDSSSSFDAVHDKVAHSLKSADEQVTVRRTGYFNHTYAPDLLLSWPTSSEERKVFVRASENVTYLAEDIDLAGEGHPIFIPLGDMEGTESSDHQSSALHQKSKISRTLVAPMTSFAALGRQDAGREVRKLAGRAVLQGATGVLGAQEAGDFSDSIRQGFAAALQGDVESTRIAVRESLELLDDRRSAQLSEVLQAAWVGGGHGAASFPGIGNTSAALDPDALRFLLDTIDVEDEEFWKRLSRNIKISHLSGLTISESHEGFQLLMKAAAHRLVAKAARAFDLNAPSVDGARWAVNDGVLLFALGKTRIEFTERSIKDLTQQGASAVPTVHRFVRRAQSASLDVRSVILSSDERRLEFGSEDGTSITSDDRLVALAEQSGAGTGVARASIAADGKELAVSFGNATSSGQTTSLFYMSTLTDRMLPLITDLSESEARALAEAFEEPAGGALIPTNEDVNVVKENRGSSIEGGEIEDN